MVNIYIYIVSAHKFGKVNISVIPNMPLFFLYMNVDLSGN